MKIFLITFLFPVTFFSQNNIRFIFKYDFAPSKLKKDSLITSYMYLDTNGNESNFCNEVKFKVDSIKRINNDFSLIFKEGKIDRNLNYNIIKKYETKEITYYTKFTTIDFKIPENQTPNWKLSNEKKIIGKWSCQKAETNYKGRKWTAYFTNEIPINDGPYKFTGLPGFIVEIASEDNSHKFSLIQIKKIVQPYIPKSPKNVKTISYQEYQNYLKNYRPLMSDIAGVNVNNGTSTYIMKDGSSVSINISKETLNKYQNQKEKLGEIIMDKIARQSDDNPIEE